MEDLSIRICLHVRMPCILDVGNLEVARPRSPEYDEPTANGNLQR